MIDPFPILQSRDRLRTRDEVLARPSAVPRSPGVYAWYFAAMPPGIDTAGCHQFDGLTLLYIGISPAEPPANGRPRSRSHMRKRLSTHYAGTAAGSTLRRTLGCLLGTELGIELRRVGAGDRHTFTNNGEQALDRWMAENAFVTWRETDRPWELELAVLRSGRVLPLNIRGNPSERHTWVVAAVRRAAIQRANSLPVVADIGPRRG